MSGLKNAHLPGGQLLHQAQGLPDHRLLPRWHLENEEQVGRFALLLEFQETGKHRRRNRPGLTGRAWARRVRRATEVCLNHQAVAASAPPPVQPDERQVAGFKKPHHLKAGNAPGWAGDVDLESAGAKPANGPLATQGGQFCPDRADQVCGSSAVGQRTAQPPEEGGGADEDNGVRGRRPPSDSDVPQGQGPHSQWMCGASSRTSCSSACRCSQPDSSGRV